MNNFQVVVYDKVRNERLTHCLQSDMCLSDFAMLIRCEGVMGIVGDWISPKDVVEVIDSRILTGLAASLDRVARQQGVILVM